MLTLSKIRVLSILLLAGLAHGSNIVRSSSHSQATFRAVYENKALHSQYILSAGRGTLPFCISLCLLNLLCVSFNYGENVCELLDIDRTSVEAVFVDRPGWTYYDSGLNRLLHGPLCHESNKCYPCPCKSTFYATTCDCTQLNASMATATVYWSFSQVEPNSTVRYDIGRDSEGKNEFELREPNEIVEDTLGKGKVLYLQNEHQNFGNFSSTELQSPFSSDGQPNKFTITLWLRIATGLVLSGPISAFGNAKSHLTIDKLNKTLTVAVTHPVEGLVCKVYRLSVGSLSHWTHAAFVWDSSVGIKLFINGTKLVPADTTNVRSNVLDCLENLCGYSQAGMFISDAAVFLSKALSDEIVKLIHSSGLSPELWKHAIAHDVYSCEQLKQSMPSMKPGYYTITLNGELSTVYCNMKSPTAAPLPLNLGKGN